ncbi:MAG: hypothetical protein ACE5IP_00125 [Terriglobia bacterium]
MTTPEQASTEGLSARIEQTSAELRSLEEEIKVGDIDARVLTEFRRAVDQVRLTAWAVHEWLALRARNRDAYTVLPLLTSERIRRAAQICNDLCMDLDAAEVTVETDGLRELFRTVEGLHSRLFPFFKKG